MAAKQKKKAGPESRALSDFDINQLEKEWHRQPKLMEDIVSQLADAKRDWEEAKYEVELEEAACAQRIREKPEKYGLEKTTEAAIKEAVVLHPKMQKAKRALIDAVHRKDVLEGYARVLEHRKRALEKEVDLLLAGYFSGPKQPKGDRVRPPRTGMRDDD